MFKRELSIKTRLSLSYILYILLFFIFVSFLSNRLIEEQFIEYSKKKQVSQIQYMINAINDQYVSDDFNPVTIEMIGQQAFDDGYIIGVYNTKEEMIWDANFHHGHLCDQMMNQLYNRMHDYDPGYEGEVVEKEYTLVKDDIAIGTLTIQHLSPYFYNESDLSFLTTLNEVYLVSSLIFILLAIVVASLIARRIAHPIETVTNELKNIEKGNYERIHFKQTNTKEINQLTSSINSLKLTLQHQQNLRKQLTGDVAHELRTPLSTLQATIEAMIDGVVEMDEQTLVSLNEEINRLTMIVEDLNDLHQYDDLSARLKRDQVNLSDLVNAHLKIFQAPLEQKQIELNFEDHDVVVNVDKDKINQVIVNLLSNAIKYTNDQGKITVCLKEEEQFGVLIIQDSGIGIAEADLPFIFERFYRADKSRARITGGHGIGLSIVKSIIDAHQGEIQVKSQLGEGTTFIVKLLKED